MERRVATARLHLRPPRAADAPFAFARWASQDRLLRHLDWAAHTDEAQTRAQLAWDEARWLKRSAWTWMLTGAGDGGGPLGLVQLLPQRLDMPRHHLRLGFVLAADWQGRGLMREAVDAITRHALDQPGLWRLDALVAVDNPRSSHLLECLGWQREGCLRRVLSSPTSDQAPKDAWLWATTRTA